MTRRTNAAIGAAFVLFLLASCSDEPSSPADDAASTGSNDAGGGAPTDAGAWNDGGAPKDDAGAPDADAGRPETRADRFGFASGAPTMWESDDDLERDMAAMEKAGARWFRVGVEWSHVEAKKGVLDWSVPDRMVEAVLRHHMTPLGIVIYTPTWAWRAGADPKGGDKNAPADPKAFGQFAGLAAKHYAGRVHHWEIWNEPNIFNFFAPKPDVAHYAAMLREAHVAIHAALGDDVTVISAGLSPAGNPADGSQIGPVEFLEGLYDAGAQPYMDAVGMHPYCFPALPTDTSTASWNAFLRLSNMRDVMNAHGDASKKIWLTEYGAPTGTDKDAVTEQRQSDIVVSGIDEATKVDGLGPIFVYTVRDYGTDPSDREQNFGLLRLDGTPKPAYDAVRAWVAAHD